MSSCTDIYLCQLEYCTVIWNPWQFEWVQNKFINQIYVTNPIYSTHLRAILGVAIQFQYPSQSLQMYTNFRMCSNRINIRKHCFE